MTDFDTMQALVALREHGNLSAAARALDCPKSTLSRRLANLETKLGHTLTQREGGRLRLNDAGCCYAGYGEQIMALAAEGQRSVAAFSQALNGEVRLWVDQPLARGWVTRTLHEFLARYPEISLEVRVIAPGVLPATDGTDLWLACDARTLSGFRRISLGRWQRRLYATAEGKEHCRQLVDPVELGNCPWIGLAGESGQILLHHPASGALHWLQPCARLRVDSLEMLADAIACGYGIGILPSWLAECPRHGLCGPFARVLGEWEAAPVELACYVPRGPRPRRVQALIEHIYAHVPKRWALSSTELRRSDAA